MLRLNLGCGKQILKGYKNIDVYKHSSEVIIGDIRKLKYNENRIDEILAVHVIESFYRWEVKDLLKEWYRVLKFRSKLILEYTDLDKCILNYFDSDKSDSFSPARCGFYGGQKYKIDNVDTYHRYVWRTSELVEIMNRIGFKTIVSPAQYHHRARDNRITATKI